MKPLIFAVLLLVAAVVVIFGTLYGVVQHSERRGANYPQIQLAEDAVAKLDSGSSPYQVVPSEPVDMSRSLAPFIVVYNKAGRAVAGSGYLYGSLPVAPFGILTSASGSAYHAVTWQPAPSVRIAAVTVAGTGYYVLSGRSLTEVEKNELQSLLLSAAGGLMTLILLGAACLIAVTKRREIVRAVNSL